MDIDSPPAALPDPPTQHSPHTGLALPSFSASFPLPFRVLFLVGLAQLLWATNLHVLHLLGLDTPWILDYRDSTDDDVPLHELNPEDVGDAPPRHVVARPESRTLHWSVYSLFLLYSAWVGTGWVVFRIITGGNQESMERWRGLVGIIALGAAVGVFAPWRGVGLQG